MTYNEALRRVDHPKATWHVVVAIDGVAFGREDSRSKNYDDVDGLLEDHDAHLVGVIADAHRTSVHFIADPAHGAVAAAMGWARSVPGARAETHPDPAWRFRKELLLTRAPWSKGWEAGDRAHR